MSYLSELIEQHQQKTLNHISDLESQVKNALAGIYERHVAFCQELTREVDQHETRLTRDNKRQLDDLASQYDQELSNQQTVALKMSMVKEYDRQVRDLKRDLELANRQIAQLKRGHADASAEARSAAIGDCAQPQPPLAKPQVLRNAKPLEPPAKSQHAPPTCPEVPVKTEPVSEVPNNDESGDVSEKVTHVNSAPDAGPLNKGAGSNEACPFNEAGGFKGAACPLPQRRRIKYKGEIYYYDPETLAVYREQQGGDSVGRKEDKRLLLDKN